jgi:hypothetical protein
MINKATCIKLMLGYVVLVTPGGIMPQKRSLNNRRTIQIQVQSSQEMGILWETPCC